MRLIPASRYFTCGSCGSHILFIFNKPFQLKARGEKPKIMACLHNYWSGKASSSFTINFNYFLRLTEETNFLNILSKLVTRKFIEKYCRNFVLHCDNDHRDTVLMVKIIFLLIIYEVQFTDCQTDENFRKFLNLASDLPVPDLAVIRSSGMAMGIAGFQDLLTNLMLRVRQRYHEIESNQPPKPDPGQLRDAEGRRSKAIRLVPGVAAPDGFRKSGKMQRVLVTVRPTGIGEIGEGRIPLETASQASGLEQPREVE